MKTLQTETMCEGRDPNIAASEGPYSFSLRVDHSSHTSLAKAYADRDLEYIRKRMNANRNLRNIVISQRASRTYEAMKTLIDTVQTIYGTDSALSCIELYPEHTEARVIECSEGYVQAQGVMKVTACSGATYSTVRVEYVIRSEFTQDKKDGSEKYNISCALKIVNGNNADNTGYLWEEVYPINPNDILGYAENFPPPSAFAGRFITELVQYLGTEGYTVNVV